MASQEDIVKLIAQLSAAFPNWKPNAYTVEIYYQDLKDIDSDELFTAAQHCRTSPERDQRFAPSTGEVRMAVLDLRKMKSGIPSAYDAWREVRQFIADNGYYVIPQWSHPLIEKTVRVFGLENLRMSENGMSDRMRFIEAYQSFVERVEKEEMLVPEIRESLADVTKQLEAQSQMKQLSERLAK